MADSVNVTNMPDPGSKEAIAYKLWYTCAHVTQGGALYVLRDPSGSGRDIDP